MINVLYFTCVGLHSPTNGGTLVCRNHARRMASDPRLKVAICNTGVIEQFEATKDFAESLGTPLYFIPFQQNPPQPRPEWPFLMELEAASQPHVNDAVLEVISGLKPDIIVVDYLFSALFAPSVLQ